MSGFVKIKLAKDSDLVELSKIYQQAFNDAKLGEKWSQKNAYKFLKYWFRGQPDLFFIAVYINKVIGGVVAECLPYWDGNRLIDGEVFVERSFRKKGIAKLLLKKLFEKALSKYKIVKFEGLADKTKDFPMNWYKKLGMKETKLKHLEGDPKEILKNL